MDQFFFSSLSSAALRKVRLLTLLSLSVVDARAAALQIAPVFADHMVLQRERPIWIWGNASSGTVVRGQLGDESAEAKVEETGHWRLEFSARKASAQPVDLVVRDGSDEIRLHDLLVGEVWWCGGQSNMVRPLNMTVAGDAAAVSDSQLRFLKVQQQMALTPASTFLGKWEACTPATALDFSAVAYYFGRDLRQSLDVPVGLILSAVGGTPAEAWTPRPALEAAHLNRIDHLIEAMGSSSGAGESSQKLREWRARRASFDDPSPGLAQGWQKDAARPGADWQEVQLPGSWEKIRIAEIDGPVWFQKTFLCVQAPAEGGLLSIGVARNKPKVWLNGTELVLAPAFAGGTRVVFAVPPALVKAGDNVVAVRLVISGGKGGFQPADHPMGLYPPNLQGAPLADLQGSWLCRVEQGVPVEKTPKADAAENKASPAMLWNGMVAPLVPIGLRGVIWYQGEANVPYAEEYRTLFPLLIRSWRQEWGDPLLPFLYVQLAGYERAAQDSWPPLRAAQEAGLSLERTAMVAAYDEGDPVDIHPRNKKPVGDRLARVARALVYQITPPAEGYSPHVRDIAVKEGAAHIVFLPETDLKTRDGQAVRGFSLGVGGGFQPVAARIEGREVVVPLPVGEGVRTQTLRFAWANAPDANLVSSAGLPVFPFEKELPAENLQTGHDASRH